MFSELAENKEDYEKFYEAFGKNAEAGHPRGRAEPRQAGRPAALPQHQERRGADEPEGLRDAHEGEPEGHLRTSRASRARRWRTRPSSRS
jgi:hypothetical protein